MEKKPFVTKSQVEEIVKTYPTPFHLYDEKKAFVRMQKKSKGSFLHGIRDSVSILQ